ncbi:hypothetical protein THAOC_21980, partial [Thalassiosira oceanica]
AQQQGLGALGVARRSGLDDVGMPTPSPLESSPADRREGPT